jgi:hypothetical protein
MRLTNEQLEKLQKQCLESGPFPAFALEEPKKGKEKEAETTAKEIEAKLKLFDVLREALPGLVDELLSARHKLNV